MWSILRFNKWLSSFQNKYIDTYISMRLNTCNLLSVGWIIFWWERSPCGVPSGCGIHTRWVQAAGDPLLLISGVQTIFSRVCLSFVTCCPDMKTAHSISSKTIQICYEILMFYAALIIALPLLCYSFIVFFFFN